jgi:carbamoyl-phosphate synthase large subunit
MVKNTNWQGPFELEFIKTYQDEKPIYHLIEINPRFPAWCYLTTGCGQNQVESAVNLVLNKKCNYYKTYEVGQMFIRYSFDQIVSMKSFETISTLGEF